MTKRTYKKYKEVYLELEDFCRKSFKKGNYFLPPEREMAHLFKTSLMTLRKALEKAQMEGILIRNGRRLEIRPAERYLFAAGKILFIANGAFGKPFLGAINRLYQDLALKFSRLKADFEFYELNDHTNPDDLKNACRCCSVLLLGYLTENHELNREIITVMQEQQRSRLVIALSEPYAEHFDNYCALDNLEVGRMAAENLLRVGCKRIAFVGSITGSSFCKRFAGMEDVCSCAGAFFYDGSFTDDVHRRSASSMRKFNEAIAENCDGIFVASDEGIAFVVGNHCCDGTIPDKVKLLTLHGSGEALCFLPGIACINHATEKVADTLISYLFRRLDDPAVPPLRALLKPDLYPSITLGRQFSP